MVRTCVAAMAALALGMSSEVAPAHAELVVIPMPPKSINKVTREGYAIEMRLERESLTPTPNLAAAPNSHEASHNAFGGITTAIFKIKVNAQS